MYKNININSKDWTCDICGQEAENLYYLDNCKYSCNACRENKVKKQPKAKVK